MESPPLQNLKFPRVGLIYDERMAQHDTPDGERHLESPLRIKAIWDYLESQGITKRCVILKSKEADDNQLAYVHTKKHIKLIRNISSKQFDFRRLKIASKFNSIYFNNGSSEAAYLAAGSVIEASISVASGDLNSTVAIVRPPGHHAEENEAMGFCLFNNVAVAANVLLNEKTELGIKKILIVDWDVHHGNGIQNAFYEDPRVLFFSVHRYDFGTFYPSGGDGSHCMTGEKDGAGYNINVPWEQGDYGDADYIAVWDHVLIPVTEAYNPDIILVSAGFDAAKGDPLGGCCITPVGYSILLQKLMRFAGGKIMMALEGGYNLISISKSVFACVETLLEEEPLILSIEGRPLESTRQVIHEVRNVLKKYWPVLASDLPDDLLSRDEAAFFASIGAAAGSSGPKRPPSGKDKNKDNKKMKIPKQASPPKPLITPTPPAAGLLSSGADLLYPTFDMPSYRRDMLERSCWSDQRDRKWLIDANSFHFATTVQECTPKLDCGAPSAPNKLALMVKEQTICLVEMLNRQMSITEKIEEVEGENNVLINEKEGILTEHANARKQWVEERDALKEGKEKAEKSFEDLKAELELVKKTAEEEKRALEGEKKRVESEVERVEGVLAGMDNTHMTLRKAKEFLCTTVACLLTANENVDLITLAPIVRTGVLEAVEAMKAGQAIAESSEGIQPSHTVDEEDGEEEEEHRKEEDEAASKLPPATADDV